MDFLASIAALVAVVWGSLVVARGGLLASCAIVLLAGAVFSVPFFNIPAKPIPLTVDRILWLLLLVQYAVGRRWGLAEPRPLGRADKLLLAVLVALAANTLGHDWAGHNNQPLARLIFLWAMPAGLYFVAREARLTERGLRNLAVCLGLFSVYLAITALAESREAWWAVWPRYIASPEFKEFLGRGRGPLLNPAGNGLYIAAGMAAWLLLWPQGSTTALPGRRNTDGPEGPSYLIPARLAIAGLVAVSLLGLYSTLTRSVWLGGGLCIAVVLAIGVPPRWRMPVIGGGLLLAGALLATQWESLLSFKRDKQLTAKETAESVKLRPVLARVAWNMFCDRPLWGCGFGQYLDESAGYLHDRETTLALETARPYVQHNVWLSLLTETGVVGMGLFTAMLAAWCHAAWRLARGDSPPWVRRQGLWFLAVVGAYFPNAMFQDMSLVPMVNSLLFMMAGITVGLRQRTTAVEIGGTRRT